jgi:hypothetical protein
MLLLLAALACDSDPANPSDDTGSNEQDDTGEVQTDDTGETGETGDPVVDADGDGFSAEDDCDDNDPSTYPGAAEICDGQDNDCDGSPEAISVPSTHASLEEALSASVEGELICLEAGTYTLAPLTLDKAVSISGTSSDEVTLEASAAGALITISEVSGFQLSGLTLEGTHGEGGAIHVIGSEGRLEDVVVQSHSVGADDTWAYAPLYVTDSTLELVEVSVLDTQVAQVAQSCRLNGSASWFERSDVSWDGGTISGHRVSLGSGGGSTSQNMALGAISSKDGSLALSGLLIEDIEVDVDAYKGSAIAYGFLYLSTTETTLQDVTARQIDLSAVSTSSSAGSATAIGLVHGGDWAQPLIWHGGSIEDVTVSSEALGSAYVYGVQATAWDWQDLALSGWDIQGSSSHSQARCNGFYASQWDADSSLRRVDLRGVDLGCSASTTADSTGFLYAMHTDGETTLENVIFAGNTVSGSSELEGFLYSPGPLSVQSATFHDNDVSVGKLIGFVVGESVAMNSTSFTGIRSIGSTSDASWPALFVHADSWDWSYVNIDTTVASGGGAVIGGTTYNLYYEEGAAYTEPGFVDVSDDDPSAWDLSLASDSELIDVGDPAITDTDGTRADIGAYGGPEAW